MKRLAVSNIAWQDHEQESVLGWFRDVGVNCIEVAPTMIWPEWKGINQDTAKQFRMTLADSGFDIPSFQAIYYAKDECQLFDSELSCQAALEHVEFVAQLAQWLGANHLVFGAPKTRDPGELPKSEIDERARFFFYEAARRCEPFNVNLCLEPNPTDYGCNFVNTSLEAEQFVRSVDHRNFRLVLDTACMHLAREDQTQAISRCSDILAHFHVSEPHLSDFTSPVVNHSAIANALASIDYQGTITIEMRRSDDPIASLKEAVTRVSDWYL